MAENKIENTNNAFLVVHKLNGQPLMLRREFMIYACGPGGDQENTQIVMDKKGEAVKFDVKERVEDIKGPFAHLGRVKYNPTYILGIADNESDNAKKSPYELLLRKPSPTNFAYDLEPNEMIKVIQAAIAQGPC